MSTTRARNREKMLHKPVGRRGMSFCYAMILLGSMLILGAVFLHVGVNSMKWAYQGYRTQQSLYLAEAAVDRAIWMMEQSVGGANSINDTLAMSDEEAAAGITKTYESETWTLPTGSYYFTCEAPFNNVPGTVLIHAVGISPKGDREDIRTAVFPDFNRDSTHPNPINADWTKFAMYSDHNLKINGNPTVLGGGGLYANGDIIFTGVSSEVDGPVVCTGEIYGSTTQPPAPDGSAWPLLSHQASTQSMPAIKLASYEADASVVQHEQWAKFQSGLTGAADIAAPKIYYVDGGVKLAGNFSGYGIIVATEGIEVTGNCVYSAPGGCGWAFVTPGYFKVAGTARINGSIFCHNATGTAEFIGTGTPNILGGIAADVITVEGAYTIGYDANIQGMGDLPGAKYYEGPPVVDTLFWERA